jgi:phage FluMu protein gp41
MKEGKTMSVSSLDELNQLQKELAEHPIYQAIQNLDDLTIFMQHHIYSVWDFMSLIKYLQGQFAPTSIPWMPHGNPEIRRFINDIVLEEESDEGIPLADGTTTYTSHFELYTSAMEEVKNDSSKAINHFITEVEKSSIHAVLQRKIVPKPVQLFLETTFNFLNSDKPHVIAAAFAFGREKIIPLMFSELLKKMNITKDEAKAFYYYLERHIELDGDHHGPLSLKMLEILCDNDPIKIQEAKRAATQAIEARIKFWDGVLLAIQDR